MKKTKKINKNNTEKKNVSKFSELMKNKKFKWILIASIAFVLCVAIVLAVVLYKPMHPIEKFAYKLMQKQNFEMQVSLYGIPLFGTVAFVVEMDGNVTHIPDLYFVEECYVEKVGDETFNYTKDESGKWVKTKSEDDSDLELLDEDVLKDLIDHNNYELVEGTKNVYRQKDSVQFENFKDITITLEKDSCTIEMIAYMEGMALETQIVISKIGQVDITLPKVA